MSDPLNYDRGFLTHLAIFLAVGMLAGCQNRPPLAKPDAASTSPLLGAVSDSSTRPFSAGAVAAAAPLPAARATTDDEMTRPPILIAPVTALEPIQEDVDEEDVGDAQWKVYFGNLHSHSSMSDGVQSPTAAFAFARDTAKVNFLCLSEHNHMTDDGELAQVESAANAATTSSFVAIAGQEFSVINSGNHINLIDVIKAVPKSDNSNYKKLYTQTLPAYKQANPNRVVVCQFNHPGSVAKDYGIAKAAAFPNYNGDFDAFRDDADPFVSLIAVISGPADADWPKNKPPLHNQHVDAKSSYLAIWKTYLDRGFHLSPTADQDNHRVTWGDRTTARTGVWVKGAFKKKPSSRRSQQGALSRRKTRTSECS